MGQPTVLLLLITIVTLYPSGLHAASSCKSAFYRYYQCTGDKTYCCSWSSGGISRCCDSWHYKYTSSKRFSFKNGFYYTSCYSGYKYNPCLHPSDSKCCFRTRGESSTCCSYWSGSSGGGSSSGHVRVYIGGSVGGFLFLVLVIVISVRACRAYRHRRGATGATNNVASSGNRGAPIRPPPGYPLQQMNSHRPQYGERPLPGQDHPPGPPQYPPPPGMYPPPPTGGQGKYPPPYPPPPAGDHPACSRRY